MMQLIIGQGEDDWTAVEIGWEAPFVTTKVGFKVIKPKANWTTDEKNLSKFNARAMNVTPVLMRTSSTWFKEVSLLNICRIFCKNQMRGTVLLNELG